MLVPDNVFLPDYFISGLSRGSPTETRHWGAVLESSKCIFLLTKPMFFVLQEDKSFLKAQAESKCPLELPIENGST